MDEDFNHTTTGKNEDTFRNMKNKSTKRYKTRNIKQCYKITKKIFYTY